MYLRYVKYLYVSRHHSENTFAKYKQLFIIGPIPKTRNKKTIEDGDKSSSGLGNGIITACFHNVCLLSLDQIILNNCEIKIQQVSVMFTNNIYEIPSGSEKEAFLKDIDEYSSESVVSAFSNVSLRYTSNVV